MDERGWDGRTDGRLIQLVGEVAVFCEVVESVAVGGRGNQMPAVARLEERHKKEWGKKGIQRRQGLFTNETYHVGCPIYRAIHWDTVSGKRNRTMHNTNKNSRAKLVRDVHLQIWSFST